MIGSWIVVRKEKHIDDRFWICLNKDDALKIAFDVSEYWKAKYNTEAVDEDLYGDQLFNYDAEDSFRVYVKPQQIRESGEYKDID